MSRLKPRPTKRRLPGRQLMPTRRDKEQSENSKPKSRAKAGGPPRRAGVNPPLQKTKAEGRGPPRRAGGDRPIEASGTQRARGSPTRPAQAAFVLLYCASSTALTARRAYDEDCHLRLIGGSSTYDSGSQSKS